MENYTMHRKNKGRRSARTWSVVTHHWTIGLSGPYGAEPKSVSRGKAEGEGWVAWLDQRLFVHMDVCIYGMIGLNWQP